MPATAAPPLTTGCMASPLGRIPSRYMRSPSASAFSAGNPATSFAWGAAAGSAFFACPARGGTAIRRQAPTRTRRRRRCEAGQSRLIIGSPRSCIPSPAGRRSTESPPKCLVACPTPGFPGARSSAVATAWSGSGLDHTTNPGHPWMGVSTQRGTDRLDSPSKAPWPETSRGWVVPRRHEGPKKRPAIWRAALGPVRTTNLRRRSRSCPGVLRRAAPCGRIRRRSPRHPGTR